MTLEKKAVDAFKKAIQGVIKRHKESGRPLAIWKDGKVVWVSPYTLEED